jgi:hypothetical protein
MAVRVEFTCDWRNTCKISNGESQRKKERTSLEDVDVKGS